MQASSGIWFFSVENVLSKFMAFRESWVLKRLLTPYHPQSLHDPLGPRVAERGKSNHLGKRQLMKSEIQRSLSPFCRKPLPPKIPRESPANFHARGEWQFSRGHMQPYETRKFIACLDFNSPEPPTTLIDQLATAVCHVATLRICQNAREIAHGFSISAHTRKGWIVGVLPLT